MVENQLPQAQAFVTLIRNTPVVEGREAFDLRVSAQIEQGYDVVGTGINLDGYYYVALQRRLPPAPRDPEVHYIHEMKVADRIGKTAALGYGETPKASFEHS